LPLARHFGVLRGGAPRSIAIRQRWWWDWPWRKTPAVAQRRSADAAAAIGGYAVGAKLTARRLAGD
jgi:hypothetical protein